MPTAAPVKENKLLSAYHSPFVAPQMRIDNVFDFKIYKQNEEKNQVSNLVLIFHKRQKENPDFLNNYSKTEVKKVLINIGAGLISKKPTIVTAEPTADDTLFFTAKYGEKTCYVEVHFEENEAPTCSLNIFENKKTIYSRFGTIENVMNSFLSLEPTFTA